MQFFSINRNTSVRKLESPLFVIGCCNSGTTILWRALLSHRELSGPTCEGQDLKELPQCMKHHIGRQTFRMFAHPHFKGVYHLTEKDYDLEQAQRLAAVYAEHCEPGLRFIEKSPANSVRTRFLQSIFPNATFIIIVRNGMAVSEGIRRKRLYDPERQHMAGLSTTIDQAAEQWYHANRIIMEDMQFLKRCIMIKYEDLVSNTPKVLRSVLDFCKLDCQDFNFPKFETNHNIKQIERLTDVEKDIIYKITGNLLTELSYFNHEP